MSNFNDADDPRRRLLIKALAAGLFSAGVPMGNAMAESIFGRPPSKLPNNQSIYRLSGEVKVNGATASLNTRIGPKDTVETGKNSEIVFVVGGNSMILRSDSHVTMEGNEEKESGSLIISGLRLITGKLLSVSRSQGIHIQTQTATIGIRGTGVYLESDPEQTYFCTCYGLADVKATNDPSSSDSVEAKHHDKPLYILANEQPGKNVRRAGFINHTDQELMLIETLVGRTPPFVFAGGEYNAPRREY